MHNGMNLQEMLAEVVRHGETKRDFVADTKEHMAMVNMPNYGYANDLAIVLAKPDVNMLERFEISDNCHKQIASRLKIPSRYYFRLLEDHRELMLENVNQLFQREPALRMIRTLDGRARAFLSNQFRRVDNEQILESTLPVIKNDFDTTILSTNVDEDRMRFKCLFNGDDHAVDLGVTKNGKQDIVHSGFEMGNSEVGKGSFFIRGFFYRAYCINGCVFGTEETVAFKQVHVGSRLGVTDEMILSNETMRKEDELIISASRDVLTNLSSPEFARKMGERLMRLKEGKEVRDPHASVEAVCKELRMSETESKNVLQSFIRDEDFSQWGMVNAITEQANPITSRGEQREVTYSRASRIEEMGNKIINLPANRWNRIAAMETIAA